MNFTKKPTPIPGCYEIQPRVHKDERGTFIKTFHSGDYAALGLETGFREEYYSVSAKSVLRGLHFQKPPRDHAKLVYCARGLVFDAVLDLRRSSPAFGKHYSLELSGEKGNMLYIPRGLAHGFCALSDGTEMFYKVTSEYSPDHDCGILWSSADIPWPAENPVVSARDRSFESFSEFKTPFD